MTLFVDTSVWSLAFRRDSAADVAEVIALRQLLESGDAIVTTAGLADSARRERVGRDPAGGELPLLAGPQG